MFAQYSTIIAVTQYGEGRAVDHNLRDISREINGYVTSASSKLQGWYGTISCGGQLQPCCDNAQAIIAELAAQPIACFDAVYAKTLSQLLQQANSGDTLGATQAMNVDMRDQAGFMNGKESDWTFRLDRWVTDHS